MTGRKVGILVTMMMVVIGAYCQVPQAINYQAVARSSNGNALVAKPINIRVSIILGSVTGQTVYQETQNVTTDNAGVFSIKIGTGTAITGVFSQINWSTANFFIKSEFDFNDGSGFQLSGTSQMLSVPYALYAGNGSKWKIKSDSATYYNSGKVGIGASTPRSFLDVISKEGNSQYTLNLSSTSSKGQAGTATWNDNGGWLKVALLGSQITDGAAFGQSGQGTVQFLSNMSGAKDMLIGTLNDQSLLLGTKNLPRLTVKNDGNVGIGTTTPAQRLDIRGDDAFVNAPLIQLATNSGNHFMTLFSGRTGDPSPFVSWKKTDTLKLASFNDVGLNGYKERMRITPTGAFGIGTKNPINKLDVRGDSPFDTTVITVANSDKSHFLDIFGGSQNEPNPSLTWRATDPLRFATVPDFKSYNGYVERMRINPNGNVGIGTNTPTQRLDVRGATPDDGTLITVGNSDQSHALWMFGGRQNDPSPFLTWKDTDALRFATISNSSFAGFTERVRISSTGNLGVGTVNPKSKVHVTGGDVYVENISSGIILKSPNGQCWRITISNTGTFTSTAIACP